MSSTPLSGLNILVADAVPHFSHLVTAMLRSIRIRRIREVGDTAATMAELMRTPYDILLLDDAMKDRDSVEFVKRLRSCEDCVNRHVPIIMMATAPGAQRIQSARDAGVTEFLRKPFSANDLGRRLSTVIDAPRSFIAVETYAGPDRRRRPAGYGGQERRRGDAGTTPDG